MGVQVSFRNETTLGELWEVTLKFAKIVINCGRKKRKKGWSFC